MFSMANMVKPGYFNMARIGEVTTPGLTFFITLPGPMAALDAWEARRRAHRAAGLDALRGWPHQGTEPPEVTAARARLAPPNPR